MTLAEIENMEKEKMRLKFWRADYGETIEDADELEVKRFDPISDLEWAAEQYAEYFHDERDGWEASWPIEFHVAHTDGTMLGKVSIERESRPHFNGTVIL